MPTVAPAAVGPRLPQLVGKSEILTPLRIQQLEAILPMSTQGYRWRLLYSSTQHGCNLGTFYARARREKRTLMLVDTLRNEVFGGYTATEWNHSDSTHSHTRRNQYFGTGESFLFMFPRGRRRMRVVKKLVKRTVRRRREPPPQRPLTERGDDDEAAGCRGAAAARAELEDEDDEDEDDDAAGGAGPGAGAAPGGTAV